ncbi:MAG: HAD family hydrolase, partial [Pseudomonadota bacterium]|nr:HAD family hydrolase [Pseudomonadota bacterium]
MDGAVKALLFDLDGTVYRGTDPIPGAAAFIAGLAARGVR